MVKQRIQLRSVSNVAASKTALIDIPCGPRYHQITLSHSYASGTLAGAIANLTEIRVKVNGRVQRTYSATQLRDLNMLNGPQYDAWGAGATVAGYPNAAVNLPIFFSEPWRNSNTDKDALAWATNGWASFQIEVDVSSASTPALNAFAVVDYSPAKSGAIVKVLRQSFGVSGTSIDISTLDRRDFLQQISIYSDSGTTHATSADAAINLGAFAITAGTGLTASDLGRWVGSAGPNDYATTGKHGIQDGTYCTAAGTGSATISKVALNTIASAAITLAQGFTKVTLRKDGSILHELSDKTNRALLEQVGMPGCPGRTPGIYDLVLDHDDFLGSAVPMDGSRDVTLSLETGSAMSGTVTALIQRIGPPE